MMKIILKRGFNAFSGLHEGLVLLKDLSKPPTPNRTYMMKIILKRAFNAFSGLHKGLVLLKTYLNL
jgi:formate-dependent nitrite reductase membrane component NrfD